MFCNFFFHYIKNGKYNLLSKTQRKKMLSRAKDYYKNDKERLRDHTINKYRNLSEEDKKKRKYGKSRYHNMSEEKKHELKKCQERRYHEAKKSKNNN